MTLEPHIQVTIDMLQSGSSIAAGSAAMAKDAADETIANPQSDPSTEVLHLPILPVSCTCTPSTCPAVAVLSEFFVTKCPMAPTE